MADAPQKTSKGGRNLIVLLAIVLAVIHQDFWFWDDSSLVLGFMPVGLAYHAMYSIVAACLWALAIKIAWPHDLVALADDSPREGEAPAEPRLSREGEAPAEPSDTALPNDGS